MPGEFAEKRKSVRVETNDIVQFVDTQGNTNDTVEARSKNISASGILIESTQGHTIGDVLEIEAALPGFSRHKGGFLWFLKKGDDCLRVTGKVVRVEQVSDTIFFIGLSFVDLHDKARKAIDKYVLEQLEQ